MTITDFLETLDPWTIYESRILKEDFRRETGKEPGKWPEQTARQMKAAIHNRGLGGQFNPADGERFCTGYEVAVSLAEKYVPGYYCTKRGRGSAFQEAADSLKDAGF